jgi:hypothetical protein
MRRDSDILEQVCSLPGQAHRHAPVIRSRVQASGLAVALVGVLAYGCGGAAGTRPVRIEITTPSDSTVVREDSVEVRGRVRPARARVLVAGQPANLVNGEFDARVPLREGPNVIDVGASAGGARTKWVAVRVARVTLTRVPRLIGASREDAVDRLETLGFQVDVKEEGGLLEKLLPGDWGVCEVRPQAGTKLRKGGRVRLVVSKSC